MAIHRNLNRPKMILGLVAPSGAGKSTVCRYFAQHHDFIVIHAADPLKRAFALLFGGPQFCERPLSEELAYPSGPTRRTIMEQVGNGIHELAPGLLPSMLDDKLTKLRSHTRILVDGIRRPTEAIVVRMHDGQIIRITFPIDETKPCDISQQAVRADYVIERPPLDELDAQLAELAKYLNL